MKYKALAVATAIVALMILSEPASAQENGYPALDLMVEACQSYRDGLAQCDATTFQTAGEAFLDIRRTLLNDPEGLALQYQKQIPKTAYMLGWCHLRRAEILADQGQMDLALSYFDSVATDAPDFLGGYAAIMTGDILLRRAVEEKYRLLCQGELDSGQVEILVQQIDDARTNFSDASGLLSEEADLQVLVHIKSEDVLYELARLYSSFGDSARAQVYYDSISYSTQNLSTGAAPDLAAFGSYYNAVTKFEQFLLTPANSLIRTEASSLENSFNQFDKPYRLAVIERMNDKYTDPIDKFENAGSLNSQNGNLPLPEAHYFRGFTHLELATNGDSLKRINSTPARVLGLAKEDFDNYIKAVDTLGLDHDERLNYLVTRAEHKSLLLGVPAGISLSDEELLSLSADDVKFLIRLAASTHTLPRRRCIEALHNFFNAYLPRLQSGTLDDMQNNTNTEGCATVNASRFTMEQALFYKGILQSLEAEGQIGQQAAQTFEAAAATMANVTGDFAAEATYVRARCLCRASKYDEAMPLLLHLVQDYGSVRALYWYTMTYRGMHPLQDEEDTTAIKDELYGLMLAVHEAIKNAEDQPQYDNLRINAQDMLTSSLAGHFRSPDSLTVGGIRELKCPDTLSVDLKGLTPELIMYETLSEKAAIGEQFAEQGRKDLVGFGLPKLWLAPGETYCGNSATPTIGNSFIPVPDSVHIEFIWRGRIQFVDDSANNLILDDCYTELMKDSSSINCVDSTSIHDAYFFDADIDIHDSVLIRAARNGFYLTTTKRTSHQPGDAYFKETLARDISYDISAQTDEGPFDLTQNNEDTFSFNLAAHPKSAKLPEALVNMFTQNRYLRDYAYDQKNERFLVVSSQLNNGIIVVSNDGETNTLTIESSDTLNSAEGIAVDKDGNIYIADWGNHRVLVLDMFGHERFSFGTRGQNQIENSGKDAQLMFPNRIVVEEEPSGTVHPRQKHLIVSDWFGIHKYDARGRYLDSPVPTGQDAGSCYEITLDGYGPGSTLRVHDLLTDQPRVYTGTQEPADQTK